MAALHREVDGRQLELDSPEDRRPAEDGRSREHFCPDGNRSRRESVLHLVADPECNGEQCRRAGYLLYFQTLRRRRLSGTSTLASRKTR
jgi:hypothetical protein